MADHEVLISYVSPYPEIKSPNLVPLLSTITFLGSFCPIWYWDWSKLAGSKSRGNLFDKLGNLNVAVFDPSLGSTYGNV